MRRKTPELLYITILISAIAIVLFAIAPYANGIHAAGSAAQGASYFNGSTYAQFNKSFNGNFSAVAWVEYTRFNGTGVIVSQGMEQNEHSVWYLGTGGEIPGMTLCGVFSDQQIGRYTAGWRFAESRFIGTGTWHQLACVYNSSHVSLYIDGELTNSTPTPYAMSNGSIIQVGKRTSAFYLNGTGQTYAYFTGYIKDLQIYGMQLNRSEIYYLFSSGMNSTLQQYNPYLPLGSR